MSRLATPNHGNGLLAGFARIAGLATIFLALLVPSAVARERLDSVIQDDAQLLHRPDDQLRASLQQIRELGIDRVRVTAGWSVLTRDPDSETRPEFDAGDPAAYEQDKWANLDRLVRLAHEHGLKVMIDIAFWAPHWASDDPAGPRARTNVNLDHFRDFAAAVAKRYSGSFSIPGGNGGNGGGDGGGDDEQSSDQQFLDDVFGGTGLGGLLPANNQGGDQGGGEQQSSSNEPQNGGDGGQAAPLPKVGMYTIWNEPNHPGFLMPQWTKAGSDYLPASPHHYRQMLYKAYPAVKQASPDAVVLVGALSSAGNHSNDGRTGVPPLRFIRELACVDDKLQPLQRAECGAFQQVPGDGFAHHPYSLHTDPAAKNKPGKPDNAPIGELDRLTGLLDQLVAAGRLSPALRDVFLTEYGYETNPPDPNEKYSEGDQAKFLPWAEYLAWRNPRVKMHAQFLLRDLPPREAAEGSSPTRSFGDWQSGLYFADGRPKLAVQSFKTGLYVERLPGRDQVLLWGRVRPGTGARQVRIEARASGAAWAAQSSGASARAARAGGEMAFATSNDGVFKRLAPYRKGARYRLSIEAGGQWKAGLSVNPVTPVLPKLTSKRCPGAVAAKGSRKRSKGRVRGAAAAAKGSRKRSKGRARGAAACGARSAKRSRKAGL